MTGKASTAAAPLRIRVVDSHTGGEPTRVVLSGGPDLGQGPLPERLIRLQEGHGDFRHLVNGEPRGGEVLVSALLCPAHDPTCAAGVIFFNHVGCLQMCGHGLIGLIVTLAHLGRISPGLVRIETPVGVVEAAWSGGSSVTLTNVPSFRQAACIKVELPGRPPLHGDIAWGGNWFFLVKDHGETLVRGQVDRLVDLAFRVRQVLNAGGYPKIDHVEFFGPPQQGGHARNFVLCPGRAYDRSPCGTGTSAKLACLAVEGMLAEGETWIQESIIGSQFRARYRWLDRQRGVIEPTITGAAYVTAETTLLAGAEDPFRHGIP